MGKKRLDFYHFEKKTAACKRLIASIILLISHSLLAQSVEVAPPEFSHHRGFYKTSFSLQIVAGLPDTQVYYTIDGSDPGEDNGILYTAPLEINTTTVVRAVNIRTDGSTSPSVTHSFLFLEDVVNQTNNPAGYPSQWGPYTAIPGIAVADYEMDPEITQNPEYADQLEEALLSLPTMSLVTDKDNLFRDSTNPDRGGIYIYTGPPENNDIPGLGIGWERPASIEFFTQDGSREFQVNCGVRLQGGHSRRPEKSPKHSFRLVFKQKYGPPKLEYPLFGEEGTASFNTVTLRAGFGNTWHHWAGDERNRAQYERDVWAKATQLAMGQPSGHGLYVHLYLNGIYWGLYNPTERIDREFAESYLGGGAMDYDIIKDYAQVVDGNITAWNEMMQQASAGLTDNENYQRIQGNNPDGTPNPQYEAYVDVINLIDYMILNMYGGNTDWDHHNWIAVRNRMQPGKGFKFFSWDAEHVLKDLSENVVEENNADCPSWLFQQLRENQDFRRLFADRVQLHCFNKGVLTPDAAQARWEKYADEIELAVITESARWGDYRRDVHSYNSGPFELYTKDTWLDQQAFMLGEYFPQRTNRLINQLKQAGLFPNINAPRFLINDQQVTNNRINKNDVLIMESTSGDIYYTNDSSDPLLSAASSEENQQILVAEDSPKMVLVPKEDIGSSWRTETGYDDSGWEPCSGAPGGVGYESGSGYQNLITFDVANDMHENGSNPNTSCYIRIKFTLTNDILEAIKSLKLRVRYDDGFLIYLNRRRIVETNAPASPVWNSAATNTHEAAGLESYDISDDIFMLVAGENLLAIQALNASVSSSDFLFNLELVAGDQGNTGGTVSPAAVIYTEPLTLNESTHIKARTFDGSSWSPVNDMIFLIPEELNNLKITEIHYHPFVEDTSEDHRDFEFIELKNSGSSPLDLSGVRFCRGISYTFPLRTILEPHGFIVLASKSNFFTLRYGFSPFAEYEGYLDNSGETIAMIDIAGDTLVSMRYDDHAPWPASADGAGFSLVPVEPPVNEDPGDPANWQASQFINGSPGKDDKATTDTRTLSTGIPGGFELYQNYPNPFNATTVIRYQIAGANYHSPVQVELSIYNLLGQKVAVLVSGKKEAGNYSVTWHADGFASGLYFYRLQAGTHYIQTKKMLLIR